MTERKKQVFLIALGLLIVGTIGYFALHNFPVMYLFAHMGALGVIGLFGVLTGFISEKKGRSFWWAFSLNFYLPIILGLLAVFLVYFMKGGENAIYCGGSISLAVAILLVISYLLVRKRNVTPAP